jgi:class 3 adenylate cyclase/tetratricopeptide (TPR) repeat protein
MKCPKCQFENREGVKFCEQCGARMESECPNCGTTIPLGSKFCGECGYTLTLPSEHTPKNLSFEEKLDKIQRYLPKGLTEKILSQRDKIEGERKQVTVMFCDMEGFTSLVESLGPEEAYSTMDEVYEILIHKVHDYEGTVNEMTGDGIMALFGAPIALEDAPQRAIRSALAIHREMARFSDRIKEETEGTPPIKMRVGIHTGPVVVGTLGNDLRVEFKAVGDTVNLASRMEGLAEPGATYVTEDTFKLTEGFFRFEALREREVKGKKEPVNVYRVIAPSTRRTRFDVSAERGLTPFVGRERELDLLLDGFERAKAGRGQAFSVVSEAGLGKSRLLYEFRKAVATEDATFLEGKCLSYSRGVSYHPVTDILKSNFNVQEVEGDSDIREKVRSGLKVLGVEEATTLPYLLELLSVKDSGIDKIMMSPEGRKDQIIEALKRIVLKGSEIRPLIMAFEDLHWMDKSSEELLKYLLESIPGAAVFLIFTYRPEFVHTWGAKSYHNQITLNRLSNRESIAMVTHLLGTEDIDGDLEESILEKTEGIPFFIEESLKSLKELKVIERRDSRYYLVKDIQDVAIPSTIQDVIMARVDSLPEGAKKLLQTGSVIEREFTYELIKRVTSLPEQELLSHLSVLKDSELLYERGIYPESTCIFKHALTREVVYDSILTRKKKNLHEEIGNAIEDLYEENIDEQYGVLAEHFIEGENYEKGAEYSKLARKKAIKTSSHSEAISHANREIVCLERLPGTDILRKKIIDARTSLALYYTNLNHHVEAKGAVEPIVEMAAEMSYQKRLPGIYIALGMHSVWCEEDYSGGLQYLRDALKISEKTGSLFSYWMASFFLGYCTSSNCEFEKGFEYFNKPLDISRARKDTIGESFINGLVTYIYIYQGSIDLAYQRSEKLLRLAQKMGDIYVKGMAYCSYGASCFHKGLFDEAENYLLEAVAFCEKTTHVSWGAYASLLLGDLYVDRREYEKSQNFHNRAISFLKSCRFCPSLINLEKLSIVRTKVLSGDQDIDISTLPKYYQTNKIKVYEGLKARCIGEILLNLDDQHLSEAEDWIKKAIETNKKNDMKWCLANDYVLYAELFKRKGNQSKARENLTKAIKIFKKCGADGWVKKYKEEMASLS